MQVYFVTYTKIPLIWTIAFSAYAFHHWTLGFLYALWWALPMDFFERTKKISNQAWPQKEKDN